MHMTTREMCSCIDMQTHAGPLGLGFDLLTSVTAYQDRAMDYMSNDFDADSSSRFPFRAWTNRQTNRQTRLNAQQQHPYGC